MSTVMHLLLIRFALIVGAVVLLVIMGFTAVLILKRGGRLPEARRYAEPLLRALAEGDGRGRPVGSVRGRAGRGGARRAAARAALRYLEDASARDKRGSDG
ncbi:hypothetical protein GCM10023196_033410 [Actinoallomurus vinaceus]|uniref:Uncharacterized protein n=1 Tax=Actinoallomurus vinaceus TaxID=1080074 RepID=A0ABP8UC07_9ACTN